MTEIHIPVSSFKYPEVKRSVDGIFITPDTEQGNLPVLLVHGYRGSKDRGLDSARVLADNGAQALTFTYGGYLNFGTIDSHFADVVTAYDWLRDQSGEEAEMAVTGFSYGALLATYLTVIRKVDHLLLRAPAFTGNVNSINRVKTILSRYAGTLMLVLSENEEVIAPEVQEIYWQSAKHLKSKNRVVIPGADHLLSLPEYQQAYETILVNWYQGIVDSI